jgi:hypothetical protein
MRPFRSVEDLPGSPQAFWAMLLDLDYVRAFNASADVAVELVRQERVGTRIERDLRYRSNKPVPTLLKPLMPNGIGYVERGVFDEAKGTYEHTLEPVPLGARAALKGVIRLEPQAAGIRRIYEGTVEVRLLGLGGVLEREAVSALEKPRDDEGTRITRAWLARD